MGIDLTQSFCDAAATLSGWLGLSDRVDFQQGNATRLPFANSQFDEAMTIHMAMNIAAKGKMYAEARRVLKPGSRFAAYDTANAWRAIMRNRLQLLGALLAGATLVVMTSAQAKGPGGVGAAHSSGAFQGAAPPSASSNPPGWDVGEKRGWDGGTVPPGFDDGKKSGWDGAKLPPGFDDGPKRGWDTTITPAAPPPARKN